MFKRFLEIPLKKSEFFLFGPRGTEKTSWLKTKVSKALYLDLLDQETFFSLLKNPHRIEEMIPKGFKDWIIIDEGQKIPSLLNEVYRMIENYHYRFILTGSSTRTLKRKGTNLLAGRALYYKMFPLTVSELKESFSQGSVLNISEIAREASIERKTVEEYFQITEDLLLSARLPVFTKKAKRKTISHQKFYYFKVGVYKALRPMGPFDSPEEAEGPALESLVFQELQAMNSYHELEYSFYFWRTLSKLKIDFILYGSRGLVGIEVKRGKNISSHDLTALKIFQEDYPQAKLYLFYGGTQKLYYDKITVVPIQEALPLKMVVACFSIGKTFPVML